MTKPKKHILGYTIFTTSELNDVVYFSPTLSVEGSFVTFEPQYELSEKRMVKLEGSKFTLPDRVIKEIIYQEIDKSLFKSKQ